MTRKTVLTLLSAITLVAGLSTAAVIAHEHENTKFPHERMVEIKRMMGGSL